MADWDEFILESLRGEVTPLLYHLFRTTNTDVHIPAEVMLKLEDFYLASALENAQLYQELPKLLSMLQAGGIPVIVLKGAALAETVYENVALRPMNDVDLLVRKEELDRTEAVLFDLGYTIAKHNPRGRK